LPLVKRDVLDEVIDLLGREGSPEVFFGDEFLATSEGAEGFQDLGLGFRIGGLGADEGGERFEADLAVGADLSDDAIELSVGVVFSDGLERRLELEAVEEASPVLVEVLKDFLELGQLLGSDVGVGLAEDFLLDEGLFVGGNLAELFVVNLKDGVGGVGVRVGIDTSGIQLLGHLLDLAQLRLSGGDDRTSGLNDIQLILEGAGSGRVDGGRLLLDEGAERLGLVGKLDAQFLVVLLSGEFLGKGLLAVVEFRQIRVPSRGEA